MVTNGNLLVIGYHGWSWGVMITCCFYQSYDDYITIMIAMFVSSGYHNRFHTKQ